MDKQQIVEFLEGRRRGVYTVIVVTYSEIVTALGPAMALEIIKKDLENESGKTVVLNYYSLAQAIAKFKTKASRQGSPRRNWEFKDAHELSKDQLRPGQIILNQVKAGK